ncbi:hypothetical protein Tco_1234177, partial [Tanacetum coccineum]
LYLKEVVTRHGIPVLIICDRRYFMAESVDRLCVGPKSEMLGSPVQNLFMKPSEMQAARDRQKSYADVRHKPLEFQKCLSDEPLAVPLDEIHIDDKLHFVEEPVEILEREIKKLRRSRIPIIKVRWNSKRGPEFTWEREDQFREKYPHLFTKTAPSKNVAS